MLSSAAAHNSTPSSISVTVDVLPEQLILQPVGKNKNWLSHNGDYSGRCYSSLDQINVQNVSNLSAQCVFDTSPMTYSVNGKQHVAVASGSDIFSFALP